MRRRQPMPDTLPETWLFTDERQGERLWDAIARLPRGSGIVFRHYSTPERAALAKRVAAAARRGGHTVVVAGDAKLARRIGAAGLHLPSKGPARPALTAAAHDAAGIVRARRVGARLVFVSPVFATRSHPAGGALDRVRFALLARQAPMRVAALGGVTAARFRSLRKLGADAWGAIDAWTGAGG